MPKIHIDHPTSLSKEESRKKANKLIEKTLKEFKPSKVYQEWRHDTMLFSFKTRGLKISGTIDVEKGKISVRMRLPLVAFRHKKKIEEALREKIREVFSSKEV